MQEFAVRVMSDDDIERSLMVIDQVVSGSPVYISHGEIQMGIALDDSHLSSDRQAIWRTAIQRYLTTFPSGSWVAERNGVIVGVILTAIEEAPTPFATIQDLCVVPQSRGRGVASALVVAALEEIRKAGIARVFFESGIRNRHLHQAAKRIGFSPVSMVFMRELD